MARKHHAKHPWRGRSSYGRKGKARVADWYGEYREGRQIQVDRIAGAPSWVKR